MNALKIITTLVFYVTYVLLYNLLYTSESAGVLSQTVHGHESHITSGITILMFLVVKLIPFGRIQGKRLQIDHPTSVPAFTSSPNAIIRSQGPEV